MVFPKPLSRLTPEDIPDLSREQLVWLWERTYSCVPPKGIKRGLLERSASWHVQAKRQRGLSKLVTKRMNGLVRQNSRQTQKRNDQIQRNTGTRSLTNDRDVRQNSEVLVSPKRNRSNARKLQPGARLIREWNGRPYIVDIVAQGFVLDGRTYRSLTAVAKQITGSHISGPRFFGL